MSTALSIENRTFSLKSLPMDKRCVYPFELPSNPLRTDGSKTIDSSRFEHFPPPLQLGRMDDISIEIFRFTSTSNFSFVHSWDSFSNSNSNHRKYNFVALRFRWFASTWNLSFETLAERLSRCEMEFIHTGFCSIHQIKSHRFSSE